MCFYFFSSRPYYTTRWCIRTHTKKINSFSIWVNAFEFSKYHSLDFNGRWHFCFQNIKSAIIFVTSDLRILSNDYSIRSINYIESHSWLKFLSTNGRPGNSLNWQSIIIILKLNWNYLIENATNMPDQIAKS